MDEERIYHVELNVEVPPSSASPEQTTEASKALGEALLECAEEYKDRIPEQLFIVLNDLAKVEHECVPYEVFRRRNAALTVVGAELHSNKERVEHLERLREVHEEVQTTARAYIAQLENDKAMLEECVAELKEHVSTHEKLAKVQEKRTDSLQTQVDSLTYIKDKFDSFVCSAGMKTLLKESGVELPLQMRYNLRQEVGGVGRVAGKRKR